MKINIITSREEAHTSLALPFTGPPSKPEGPLDVSDIKANGCKLKWKKPEDDGGVPVDHYEVRFLCTPTSS